MKKKLKRILIGFISLGIIYGLFIFGLILSTYREVPPKGVEVMIVLGARVKGENPAIPTRVLQERLDTAYQYLVDNPETVVIVTGGQGENESEPEGVVMGRTLVEKGIDPTRIYIEQTSTSTIENIENALQIIKTDTAIIVSNDYHIYRAKRTARNAGIETVYGLAAPSTTIATFSSYLREIVALGYHLIFSH
ncbi:hypothetical protein AOC36_00865 [Erysipelothrix larvae]|uniref:DUF218 domain-containing protein n=1 Tax=Erysipelothrix larvae TaxID=1514105 RepID=A0A0X8GYK7_9FIRM|nr:YdcF family protein [Erysipelothrix larvae]AMC92594.1 hypothetical protein AOC36_00865 [Erysipelothrix larvae]